MVVVVRNLREGGEGHRSAGAADLPVHCTGILNDRSAPSAERSVDICPTQPLCSFCVILYAPQV